MGKRIGHLLAGVILSFGLALSFGTAAYAEEPGIEQVVTNLPEVRVYGYDLWEGGMDVRADFAGEDLLLLSNTPFVETGEGIDYYVLVDVSNSIPSSYFREIRKSISELPGRLRVQDRMTLVTFGESVQLIGDMRTDPYIQEKISALRNVDNRTMLFEAIDQTSKLAAENGGPERKIFIIISDGEDVAEGKAVAQEALTTLGKNQIPVYALGIKQTARANLNSFGEFARSSGGEIRIFEAGRCGDAIYEVMEKVYRADCLRFAAGSNRVTSRFESFNLRLPDRAVPLNKEVYSFRHIPDWKAPELVKVEQLEGRRIRVFFSEKVIGAKEPSSYLLKRGDVSYPIGAVAVEEHIGEPDDYIITVSEAFPRGTYELSITGITDDSQEENPVANTLKIELRDSDPLPETDDSAAVVGFLLAVIALILLIVLLARRKKDNGKQERIDSGYPNQPYEARPAGESSIVSYDENDHHHVRIERGPKKHVSFLVNAGGGSRQIDMDFTKSMMVGRSAMCDLTFDDPNMSGQHFSLEWDGQTMLLTDLESTNGTMVNGVKVLGRRPVASGDRIKAGNVELRISW